MKTLQAKGVITRVTRNVYEVDGPRLDGSAPRTLSLDARRVRSAWIGLLSVENSVATGAAALALHGAWGLPMRIAPEITLHSRTASTGAAGVRIRQFSKPFPVIRKHGRYIAAPRVALAQSLTEFGFRRAVAVVDSCLNRELIQPEEIFEIRKRMYRQRGVRALGEWWEHIDARAESPMESYARIDCIQAGLPQPELQVEIHEGGEFIARADLGWRKDDGTWVLVEIDGREYHENPDALFRDRERQNRIMLRTRHRMLRFTGRDVMAGRVAPAVLRALRSDKKVR